MSTWISKEWGRVCKDGSKLAGADLTKGRVDQFPIGSGFLPVNTHA